MHCGRVLNGSIRFNIDPVFGQYTVSKEGPFSKAQPHSTSAKNLLYLFIRVERRRGDV
jgi:hypothetical protein